MEVKLRTLPKQVAGVLMRRIATHTIAGGVVPSELEITREFGVSRAVAREALKILASLDVVEIAQGRRVTLRPEVEWDYLSPLLMEWMPPAQAGQLLRELHEARLIAEPAITAEAARNLDDENLSRLHEMLTAMKAHESDSDVYLNLDLDFHMEICRATRNRILDRFMYSSRWWQIASRRISNEEPHALQVATEQHEAIYQALVARDPQRAEAAMRDHLNTGVTIAVLDRDEAV